MSENSDHRPPGNSNQPEEAPVELIFSVELAEGGWRPARRSDEQKESGHLMAAISGDSRPPAKSVGPPGRPWARIGRNKSAKENDTRLN